MNKIEEVARAICKAAKVRRSGLEKGNNVDHWVNKHWQHHIPEAKSAIEAMQVPTSKMTSCVYGLDIREKMLLSQNSAELLYTSMIQAALEDT